MRRRFSKTFKIVIGIIASLVVLILLVFVIGWITDLISKPSIRKAADEARLYFVSLKRDEPGNAWDYYSEAVKKCKTIETGEILGKYRDGRKEATPAVMKVILDNLDVIEKIEEGAKQDYYCYPYDYEKGILIEFPDFMSFRKAAELVASKSLYDLENGRTDVALDELFSVMTFGKQIATGAPMLIDQMMGTIVVDRALKILEMGIASGTFSEGQLENISEFLDDLEKHWPMLAYAFGSEVKLSQLSLGANAGKDVVSTVVWGNEKSGGGFVRMFLLRLLCWRSFFSPYRSIHKSLAFMEAFSSDLEKIERDILEGEKDKRLEEQEMAALNKRIDDYKRGNFFFRITAPNYETMLERKLMYITEIRIAIVSSQIETYRFRRGRFPQNLSEIAESMLVDFNTGKLWQYTKYGDSVTVFSPGPDLESKKDDITISLSKMGIKKFLERKRKHQTVQSK